jgi:hypothetical protein
MTAARRRSRKTSSSSPLGAFVVVLVVIAIIVKFIWWILGAAALIGLFYFVRAVMRENRKQTDALARRSAEIAARADQQHEWVLQGDDRGIYGPDGAKLMHYLEHRGTPTASTTGHPVIPPRTGPFGMRFVR